MQGQDKGCCAVNHDSSETSDYGLAGIVYEPKLTLDLPRPASGGTAMNALAHCVEALYPGDLEAARRGAALIVEWLPRVLENLEDLDARTHLLEGASAAGEALAAFRQWRFLEAVTKAREAYALVARAAQQIGASTPTLDSARRELPWPVRRIVCQIRNPYD